MLACFRSSSGQSASRILRSNLEGIRFCKPETPGPATPRPFPNVRSSYLFRERLSLPCHTLQAEQRLESDASAARYSPVRGAPDSGFAAAAIQDRKSVV